VDEGIQRVLSQRLQDLLASVETRAITDAVGVTTGSFFHHFANRAKFAEAVAARFGDLWQERIDRLVQEAVEVVDDTTVEQLRATAAREWSHLVEAGEVAGLQHLLWVARDQPLAEGSAVTGRQILGEAYRSMIDEVQPHYAESLNRMGREMMPPFSLHDLTVLMTVLAEGLQVLAHVDPGAVRSELYVDAVVVTTIAATRPRVERADVALPELASLEASMVVRPPVSERREQGEMWRHIADAAAPLFADRSPSEVRVAEIAEAAGVSPSTVYHRFGTVSAVAAAGWARYMPELRAIAEQPLTAEEGPLVRIEQVLTRYVELIKSNRGMTAALVSEAVNESGSGAAHGSRLSVGEIVTVPALVVAHVRELRARGLLRRRIDNERLARSLLQLCTMQALLFPEESVERIVDETMAMVFDGSLVVPQTV